MATKKQSSTDIVYDGNVYSGQAYINLDGDTIRTYTTNTAKPGQFWKIKYTNPNGANVSRLTVQKETGKLTATPEVRYSNTSDLGEHLNGVFKTGAYNLPITTDLSKYPWYKKYPLRAIEWINKRVGLKQGGRLMRAGGKVINVPVEIYQQGGGARKSYMPLRPSVNGESGRVTEVNLEEFSKMIDYARNVLGMNLNDAVDFARENVAYNAGLLGEVTVWPGRARTYYIDEGDTKVDLIPEYLYTPFYGQMDPRAKDKNAGGYLDARIYSYKDKNTGKWVKYPMNGIEFVQPGDFE